MSETKIPEDIAALARKAGKQFKSEQELADCSLAASLPSAKRCSDAAL